MCHYCSLGREVGKSPCGGVRPRLSDKRAASASWNALAWRQEPPRVHHPHTGKDCETLRPQRLCLSALRSRTVRSGRAPVRVRLYRSHHQHRRTPGPGDQPPLDHHRRQPARAGSARAGRGQAAACWRPARPSNTPAAARCPPRWARCAAPIIASARTASRSRCRFPNSSWRCRVPCTDAARRLFFWPMKRILCLSVLSALLAACTTTSEIPLNRALAQAYRPPRPKARCACRRCRRWRTRRRARWPASSSPLPGPRCPAGATTTCRSSGRCSSAIAAG